MDNTATFETSGNVELLSQQKIALYASKDAPKALYPQALRTFQKLSQMPVSVAGGWQAPLEKYLFRNISMKAKANYIFYLARNINYVQPNEKQQRLLETGKLLFISTGTKQQRISQNTTKERDALLFAQIKKIFFLYINRGGRLERYFNQLSELRYQLFVLDHSLNAEFITEDVIAVSEDNVAELIKV